jgi:hypothetical protein
LGCFERANLNSPDPRTRCLFIYLTARLCKVKALPVHYCDDAACGR